MKASDYVSEKFTISLSNSPGPMKTMRYKNPKTGQEIKTVNTLAYIMVAARLGSILCAVSYNGYIKFSLVSDTLLLDEDTNQRLLNMVCQNIEDEIQRLKSQENETPPLTS